MATSPAALNVGGRVLKHQNLLLVIKQTAFEEYSQVCWTCRELSVCIFGAGNMPP